MKKICLINPPYNIAQEAEEQIEHIGVAYIAGYLEEKGIAVDLYDCPYQAISMEELLKVLKNEKYDVVGISTYFYNYMSVKRIIRYIKKSTTGTFVFVGGYLPTLSPERLGVDKKQIDCMVLGEGELTTHELLHAVMNEQNWHDIRGICYFDKNEIVFNAPRDLVCHLDELPFPKRIEKDKKIYTVITSRGCYGHCNFCGIKEFYQRNSNYITRNRTAQNVVAEVETLIATCSSLSEIRFNDDNFALASEMNQKWFKEFVDLIQERKINLKYTCLLRANDICKSKEQLAIFKDIGLRMVFIGIESFVQKDLDFYNKKVKVEENIRALQICDELNIRYQIGFMMFNPETTLDSIICNIECLEKIGYNKKHKYYNKPISNSVVIVTEGAPLEEYVFNAGLRQSNSIGYGFRDEKVEKCYQIISQWYSHVDSLSAFSKMEEQYEKQNRINQLHKIRNIFFDLFYYDLCVLKKIAVNLLDTTEVDEFKYDFSEDIKYIETIYKRLKEIENTDEME